MGKFDKSSRTYSKISTFAELGIVVPQRHAYIPYNFLFKHNRVYLKKYFGSVANLGGVLVDSGWVSKKSIYKNYPNMSKFINFVNLKNYILNVRNIFSYTEYNFYGGLIDSSFNYYDNIYTLKHKNLYNWSDKDKTQLSSPHSLTLPWFEGYDSESDIDDHSIISPFNDTYYLADLIRFDIKKKLEYFNTIAGSNDDWGYSFDRDLFFEYYSKRRLLGSCEHLFGVENTKKLNTDIVLYWDFNDFNQKFRESAYLSLISKYYEHNINIRRLKKINFEFPSNSQRLVGLMGNDSLSITSGKIFSLQSKEFGTISSDFLGNKYNSFIDNKKILTSWKSFGKINPTFSYMVDKKPVNGFNGLNYLGKNYLNGNLNFSTLTESKKLLTGVSDINKEIVDGIWDFENSYKKFEDTDLYLNGMSDSYKNIENEKMVNSTNYFESSEKINLFSLPRKDFLDYGIDLFDSNTNPFNNRGVVSDRFLLTFKKKINARAEYVGLGVKKPNRITTNSPLLLKIIDSFGSSGIKKLKDNEVMDVTLPHLNMVNSATSGLFNKIVLNSDDEIFLESSRSGNTRPHTLYGFLWDEYLKQTYGVNINFINFNIKVLEDLGYSRKLNSLKNHSLSSRNFQNFLEKNLKPDSDMFGLSKDREIGNTVISKWLPKVGFVREISDVWVRNLNRVQQVIPFISDIENEDANFYMTQEKDDLFSDSIFRKNLTMQSIDNIRKYSENPIGFRKSQTPTGIKLPYIKRKFIVKNEDEYFSGIKNPSSYSWHINKNNTESGISRYSTTTEYVENQIFGNSSDSPNRAWSEPVYLNNMLTEPLDYEFNDNFILEYHGGGLIKDFNSASYSYFDFDDDTSFINNAGIRTKRSADVQEFLNNKIKNVIRGGSKQYLSAFSNLEENSIRKQKNNMRLFKKLEIYGKSIIGSSLVEKYRNSSLHERNVFFVDIFNNRKGMEYGDFYNFENPIIRHMRNGNVVLKKKKFRKLN